MLSFLLRRQLSRGTAPEAELHDRKQGFDAIEERARYELGMIRQDEIFFQVVAPLPGLPKR